MHIQGPVPLQMIGLIAIYYTYIEPVSLTLCSTEGGANLKIAMISSHAESTTFSVKMRKIDRVGSALHKCVPFPGKIEVKSWQSCATDYWQGSPAHCK